MKRVLGKAFGEALLRHSEFLTWKNCDHDAGKQNSERNKNHTTGTAEGAQCCFLFCWGALTVWELIPTLTCYTILWFFGLFFPKEIVKTSLHSTKKIKDSLHLLKLNWIISKMVSSHGFCCCFCCVNDDSYSFSNSLSFIQQGWSSFFTLFKKKKCVRWFFSCMHTYIPWEKVLNHFFRTKTFLGVTFLWRKEKHNYRWGKFMCLQLALNTAA